jgi:uncharacterized protein (DUF1330 family)
MLWATPGGRQRLAGYEDRVLRLLGSHEGRLLIRASSLEGEPAEVQILEFPSEAALVAFQNDPERLALAKLRADAVARTEILRVAVVED